jgi:hypothetical protein
MKYKSAEGQSVDFQKLDTNKDGKVSQSEWNSYHAMTGAAGRTGGDTSGGTASGGAGRSGGTRDKPPGTSGSGSTGTTK